MSDQVKRVGRPRKWVSDAERKRAYRLRRAAELADPLELREAVRAARAQAAESAATAALARHDSERWRTRADAAERRAQEAAQRLAKSKEAAHRAFAERDEARRLLRRKLQWASHAEELRDDPDALLALVAEVYEELAQLRKQLAAPQQQLQRPNRPLW